MRTINTHGTFEEALTGSSDLVTGIAEQLRVLIIGLYPDVVEVPWPSRRSLVTAWARRRCRSIIVISVPSRSM